MFFRRDGGDAIAITAGSLDQPTGLKLIMRIFTDEMADYAANSTTNSGGDGIPHHGQFPDMFHFAIPEE